MQRALVIPFLSWAAVSLMAVDARGIETPSKETMSAAAQEGANIASKVFEASDPKAAREQLSPAEREKFDKATMPASLEVSEEKRVPISGEEAKAGEQAAAGSDCYGYNQTFKRKAALGNTLYTYWQSTHVCRRNGRITSVKVTNAGGETSTPGWRIDKGPNVATKNVGWEGRGNAQYHFVLGVGGWDIAHPTDCIQQRVNVNGHSHRSMPSCNLDAR
jgi:hypothetical protein